MKISAKTVMELRKKTNAGMMDCKKALQKTDGDMEKAIKYLREKGISKAEKKSDRATKEGRIHSYIHGNGKIGVLVEVNCETDFVARNDKFIELCKDIAMHIAASNPLAINENDLDNSVLEAEKEIFKKQALNDGKPEKIIDRIVEGRLNKFKKQNCLMKQEFIKDNEKTIEDVIKEAIVALGENINIERFTRYSLGN